MAFLFVVHVPYSPRSDRSGFGKDIEETEENVVHAGDNKLFDLLEEVVEEDYSDVDINGWIGSEESIEKQQKSNSDNATPDLDEADPSKSVTHSENEVNSEENGEPKEVCSELTPNFKKEESADKTVEHKTDTDSKEANAKEPETFTRTEEENDTEDVDKTEDELASQSSKAGSPSKNSENSEDKEVGESVLGTTKTFDVIPVEETDIKTETETASNTVDPEGSFKELPIATDGLIKAASEIVEKDVDKTRFDDTETCIEEKHLTPLIQFDPIHKQVLRVLKTCQVENASQQRVGDGNWLRISFVKEDSKNCEDILNKLKALEIGKKAGTSISIFPTSVHESFTVEQATEPVTPVDENDRSLEVEEKESKFKKSIKSRLIVQQVVDSVRSNAEFTFDYLLLLVLASLIACMGLVENSSVVLVASMLISPLMGPILAGTFGHVIKVYELRNLGVKSEVKGLLICVVIGFLFGLIAGGLGLNGAVWGSSDSWPTIEMKSRGMLRSLWVGVLIAVPSGAGVAIGVLGGNAGSLVGVAISASLLPPAVNAGMLWAYGLLAAIRPPAVISNTVITTLTTIVTMTTSLPNVTDTGNVTTLSPNITTSTSSPSSVPESCLPLVNNEYQQFYSCNVSHDAALLGLVSLLLTVLNITCIFFMGILVLKIKEVAPTYEAATTTVNNFWHEDMKVARTYYETTKGLSAKKILKEWQKFKEELQTKPVPEEQKQLQKNVETVNCINYISRLKHDHTIQRFMARLSPSDTCLRFADDLKFEYEQAKENVDEQYRKDPAIYLARYQPKARNKKVEKAYHTVHNVTEEDRKPSLAELRNRFKKGGSLYIENVENDSGISPPGKKKTKTSFALKSPTQNKLFNRRKVKFQDSESAEAENLV